jgi:hypothetical protein
MPLRFDACVDIVQAQYNGLSFSLLRSRRALTSYADRLDAISALQDVETFSDIIRFEVEARSIAQRVRGKLKNPLEDRDKLASVVGTVYAAGAFETRGSECHSSVYTTRT